MKTSAESINNLPQSWQLTPLGKLDKSGKINLKAPYLDDWQKLDLDRGFINSEIESGKAIGIGLRLGEPSGYIVAIDFDGQSAIELGIEKFGEIPITVTWTSGRPGRYQALFLVPEQYRQQVKNKKVSIALLKAVLHQLTQMKPIRFGDRLKEITQSLHVVLKVSIISSTLGKRSISPRKKNRQ
jgi:Bifunctional DNA primase/polymerase, N-terminal